MVNPDLTFRGKPCKRGHSGIRWISTHQCVECMRNRLRLRRGNAPRVLHGYSKLGYRSHPLYKVWEGMIARCENPNNISYPRYGAKGIKVCERWRKSFPDFLADVGERPGPDYDLHRIDEKRNYEPSNVRWMTKKEHGQINSHVKLTIEKARAIRSLCASGLTYKEVGDRFGVRKQTIHKIVNNQIWKE